jgi:hypothetical protein
MAGDVARGGRGQESQGFGDVFGITQLVTQRLALDNLTQRQGEGLFQGRSELYWTFDLATESN